MRNNSLEALLELSPMECEVITLMAVLRLINATVNYETMIFSIHNPHSQVSFKDSSSKDLVSILLVDFLSIPKEFFREEKDFLNRLSDICQNPLFGKKNIDKLSVSVENFEKWLAYSATVDCRWFPSLNLESDLNLPRRNFIRMCGNMSKHNFTQQTRQAQNLKNCLAANNHSFTLEQCLIALEDFYEQFHHDIFEYHFSAIAEFLNNIRWAIYHYVKPQRENCVYHKYNGDWRWESYKLPPEVITELGKKYYNDLMGAVKTPPYVPQFEVTKFLKLQY